ncbi:MAG: ABC transporter ATP-binding protein [Desulfuromonadaceae bacterium]|nr:ABC transporter ATP-binding protein [Desulfuromonadaceae bacterium]
MLAVAELYKRFAALEVLSGFSLTVPRNGFTALVGPSGCGKSTFFDLLTGVVAKDRGQISWLGEEVDHLCGVASYMQQKDLLLPWLSLMDNALLPVRVGKGVRKGEEEKARALFRRLGLEGFEGYIPGKVSGGMRQRCALVRTLMFERELVLLDEPLSALDAITRRSLHSVLLLLQTEFKKTLLMITHDVEEALLLADEVVVLSQAPMKIRERFRLTSAKPRKITDPELMGMKEHILEELQEELNHDAV